MNTSPSQKTPVGLSAPIIYCKGITNDIELILATCGSDLLILQYINICSILYSNCESSDKYKCGSIIYISLQYCFYSTPIQVFQLRKCIHGVLLSQACVYLVHMTPFQHSYQAEKTPCLYFLELKFPPMFSFYTFTCKGSVCIPF